MAGHHGGRLRLQPAATLVLLQLLCKFILAGWGVRLCAGRAGGCCAPQPCGSGRSGAAGCRRCGKRRGCGGRGVMVLLTGQPPSSADDRPTRVIIVVARMQNRM